MAFTDSERQHVLSTYDTTMSPWMRQALVTLTGDPDKVLGAGHEVLDGMIDELPYVDRPQHTMAAAIFACASMLAVFRVVRSDGVDEHAWGRALHAIPSLPPGLEDQGAPEETAAASAASLADAKPNEFVFEVLGPDETRDYGVNIKSCAICHLFAHHDAMDLVPYMCAFDDALSDKVGQGLKRTGTIALGASHCDFRFKKGGEPLRLVEQYANQVRLEYD